MQNPTARRVRFVILIAFVAVLVWLLRAPEATAPASSDDANRSAGSSVRRSEASPDDRPETVPATRRESLVPMQKNRLDSFFIPAVSGHKLTVTEALVRLDQAFSDACRSSRVERPPLTLEARGDPGRLLTFSLAGSTFSSNLRHLAALAEMEVMQTGRPRNGFVLVMAPPRDGPAEVIIHDPVVFARGFREMGGMVARPEFTPPFFRSSHEPEDVPPTLTEWREILRRSGLCQDSGIDCQQDEYGNLRITGSAADLRRVESAKVLVAESRSQMKVTTRLLAADSAIVAPGEVQEERQNQLFMREMAQKKGTDLMTLPSVTMLQNQPVNLEIIKERKTDGQPDWTGVKFAINARFAGWRIAGNPHCEIRSADSEGFSAMGGRGILVKSGETATLPLTSPEKAGWLCLVTIQRIDATGRPLDSPPEREQESPPPTDSAATPPAAATPYPSAKAVPGTPGMVFSPHSQKIVDVRGMPPGTLVADPTFPEAEKKYFRVP